jgi:hypothetical protein
VISSGRGLEAMPRFRVGQFVHLIAGGRARTRDTYEVKRVLPSDGEPQYRIRSTLDPFERVALESEMEIVPLPLLRLQGFHDSLPSDCREARRGVNAQVEPQNRRDALKRPASHRAASVRMKENEP